MSNVGWDQLLFLNKFCVGLQLKCSQGLCLASSIQSNFILGCTFSLYTSQSKLLSLKRNCRSPRIATKPVSSSNSFRMTSLEVRSCSSVFPQTDCHNSAISLFNQQEGQIPFLSQIMTIIYFALELRQFLHSISLLNALIGIFAKAQLLSFSSLKKASAWDILLL